MQSIESLLRAIDQPAGADVRAAARELVQALLELHNAGLATMMRLIADNGESTRALIDSFKADPLVANLLLLHNLHPDSIENRVRKAVNDVRPQLRAFGGDIQLLEVTDGIIRLLVTESAEDGPLSEELKRMIEDAIHGAAPDAAGIEIEVIESVKRFISLPVVGHR